MFSGMDLIVKTPGVLGGRARIRGTRIAVSHIVSFIKAGYTVDEIIREIYPNLTREQVEAALEYYRKHKEEIEAELEEDERIWTKGLQYTEALIEEVKYKKEFFEELRKVRV